VFLSALRAVAAFELERERNPEKFFENKSQMRVAARHFVFGNTRIFRRKMNFFDGLSACN
jgi:hypothetical protein